LLDLDDAFHIDSLLQNEKNHNNNNNTNNETQTTTTTSHFKIIGVPKYVSTIDPCTFVVRYSPGISKLLTYNKSVSFASHWRVELQDSEGNVVQKGSFCPTVRKKRKEREKEINKQIYK